MQTFIVAVYDMQMKFQILKNGEVIASKDFFKIVAHRFAVRNGIINVGGFYNQPGTYQVRMFNSCFDVLSNECEFKLKNSGGIIAGAEYDKNRNQTFVYPNPANTHFYVKSEENIKKILIIDNIGRMLKTFSGFENSNKFDISNLPSAVYKVVIITDKRTSVSKLVVMQ